MVMSHRTCGEQIYVNHRPENDLKVRKIQQIKSGRMRAREGLTIVAILTKLRVENGWTDCGADGVRALSGVV
jgi:hypothetical protein